MPTAIFPKHTFAKLAALLLLSMSLNGWCQDGSQTPGIYDRIWNALDLYENKDNEFIQSFSLIGRYHGQYWSVDAKQGNDRDFENRRRIAGFSSRWFQDFTVQAQMFMETGSGSLYDGLYEAYVQWEPEGKGISLSVGRLDYLFTGYERSKSSKRINTLERGLLVNQVMPAEVFGAHLRVNGNSLDYHAGLFSRGIKEEFDDLDSGTAAVVGASAELPLFMDTGRVHLDYLYNPNRSDGNAFKPYNHVLSLWHSGESGRITMNSDLTLALPLESSGHVIGLTLEPGWRLLDNVLGNNDPLDLTLRYQFVSSSKNNMLLLQKRYEQKVTSGEGDQYQALYAGLSYFLYDHKFKLMLGGEYASMEDKPDDGGRYRGWTWSAAVRLYF